MSIIIYSVGSPILVDVAESCTRLRLPVLAWVRNIEGESFAPPDATVLRPADLTEELARHAFLVPLFTPRHRYFAQAEARRHGLARAATVIDPTAVVASSSILGDGSYVNALATIGGASRIGAFAFVNRNASIGHHAELADFVSIGPGAVIAGHVEIGAGVMVGAGAVVLPKMRIGRNAVVAAGAVVTKPVEPNSLVAGNPARVVKTGLPAYDTDTIAGS
jgi:sugar O-acyltransferase (sialic acid O-acetyltransferase NeuD family)